MHLVYKPSHKHTHFTSIIPHTLHSLTHAGSRYEHNSVSGDLIITGVMATDMANYNCTASNEVGVASTIVEVLVRGESELCSKSPLHSITPSPGAPVTNLSAVVLNSTAVSLTWSHPPSHLTPSLTSYLLQYGVSGSQKTTTMQLETTVDSALFSDLEEATQYEFSVFGDYGDVMGVVVTVVATTDEDSESFISLVHPHSPPSHTLPHSPHSHPLPHSPPHPHSHTHPTHTHSHTHPLTPTPTLTPLTHTPAVPTAPPQNVSVKGEVEALEISWLVQRHTNKQNSPYHTSQSVC